MDGELPPPDWTGLAGLAWLGWPGWTGLAWLDWPGWTGLAGLAKPWKEGSDDGRRRTSLLLGFPVEKKEGERADEATPRV